MKSLLKKIFVLPLEKYSLTKTIWLFMMLPWLVFDILGLGLFFLLIQLNADKSTTMYTILPAIVFMSTYLLYINIVCIIKSKKIVSTMRKYISYFLFFILAFISFMALLSFSIAGMQTLQNI